MQGCADYDGYFNVFHGLSALNGNKANHRQNSLTLLFETVPRQNLRQFPVTFVKGYKKIFSHTIFIDIHFEMAEVN